MLWTYMSHLTDHGLMAFGSYLSINSEFFTAKKNNHLFAIQNGQKVASVVLQGTESECWVSTVSKQNILCRICCCGGGGGAAAAILCRNKYEII